MFLPGICKRYTTQKKWVKLGASCIIYPLEVEQIEFDRFLGSREGGASCSFELNRLWVKLEQSELKKKLGKACSNYFFLRTDGNGTFEFLTFQLTKLHE